MFYDKDKTEIVDQLSMHEYLTIENLLKRYLVTFTIKIQATGTN